MSKIVFHKDWSVSLKVKVTVKDNRIKMFPIYYLKIADLFATKLGVMAHHHKVPPKGGQGCLMSPPCLESQGCHLFHFAIFCLVLLPSLVTLSVLSFSVCWSTIQV